MKKSVLAAVVFSALCVCGAQARSAGAEAAFEAVRPASMTAAFERTPSLPSAGVEGAVLRTAALERQPVRYSGNDWAASATGSAPAQKPGTYGVMFLGLLIIGALVRQRCINQD